MYILIYLNSQGKGTDIAKEEAAAWARQMEFINSNPLEEQAFRSWLSGETDIMPEIMPVNKYIMGFPHRKNVELCYLSKVCTFTERLLVYGIKKGYVDVVRRPVKEMIMDSRRRAGAVPLGKRGVCKIGFTLYGRFRYRNVCGIPL